jgi:hypothetical protein
MRLVKPVTALLAIVALAVVGCIPTPTDPGMTDPLTINHTNFDPASLPDADIAKAVALGVYFEHASVGQNIVDGIGALGGRYTSGRVSWSSTYPTWTGDPAWFDTHDGLADNHRGNPGGAEKISFFQAAITPTLASKIDVASFKFCYIDTPADAAALFSSAKSAMEGLQAAYPAVVFVWWTMPIERDGAAPAQRQAYNDSVRAYCAANDQWLLDIAALESHDDSGTAVVDVSDRELLYSGYTDDGGHLNAAGAAKLAKAYWKLIAEIARTR